MADATAFNLKDNQKAERKLLVTCVDVSDNAGTFDASTADWQIVGVGVEDSSIEYNPDTETVTDILGITETTVNKLETEQDLDPMTIRGGSKLAIKLYNQVKYGRLSELSMYNVMHMKQKFIRTAQLLRSLLVVMLMLICPSTSTSAMTRFMALLTIISMAPLLSLQRQPKHKEN